MMYMLNADKERVKLQPLETEVSVEANFAVTVRTAVNRDRDPANAEALVARACRTHFDIGLRDGLAAVAEPPTGPPPMAFRETDTGLLHVCYREITIRFKPAITQKLRQSILKKYQLTLRSMNLFVEDQLIVYNADRKYSGEKLLDIANDIAGMD